MDDQGKFFLEDETAKKVWQQTLKISDVNAADYKALFIVGGHGPMMDLPRSDDFRVLVEEVSREIVRET